MPRGTRIDELESAVRTVCEPIFNKPLKEISFAQVLLRLFEVARPNMSVRHQTGQCEPFALPVSRRMADIVGVFM